MWYLFESYEIENRHLLNSRSLSLEIWSAYCFYSFEMSAATMCYEFAFVGRANQQEQIAKVNL